MHRLPIMVNRCLPAANNTPTLPTVAVIDAFSHAHPHPTVLHTNMHAHVGRSAAHLPPAHRLAARATPPIPASPHPCCCASAWSVDRCCSIRASAASDRRQSVSLCDATYESLHIACSAPRKRGHGPAGADCRLRRGPASVHRPPPLRASAAAGLMRAPMAISCARTSRQREPFPLASSLISHFTTPPLSAG